MEKYTGIKNRTEQWPAGWMFLLIPAVFMWVTGYSAFRGAVLKGIYPVFTALLAGVGVLTFFLFRRGAKYLTAFYAAAALGIGLLYIVLMPGIVVPDAPTHFAITYDLASSLMQHLGIRGDVLTMGPEGLLSVSGSYKADAFETFWGTIGQGNTLVPIEYETMSNIPFYPYLPAAIGVMAARLLGLPWQFIVFSGQIMNLILFVLSCLISMKLAPSYRFVFAAIGLLPSMLWLTASYSYDSWNLAFILLFFAYLMRVREQETGVRLIDLVILLILLVAFAPIKYVYVVLGLFVFTIPKKQWKNKWMPLMVLLAGAAAAASLLLLRGQEAMGYLVTDSMDERGMDAAAAAEGAASYTIGYALKHIPDTFLVFAKTLFNGTDYYAGKSIIGEYYNQQVPAWLQIAAVLVFALLCVTALAGRKISRRYRLAAGTIFALGILALLAAFLFLFTTITPDGVGEIGGIQGRYLVPFYVCLPILLKSDRVTGYLVRVTGQDSRDGSLMRALSELMVVVNCLIVFYKLLMLAD